MPSRRGFLAWAGVAAAGVWSVLARPRPGRAHHKPGHGGTTTTTTTSTTTTLPPVGDLYTDVYANAY